MNPILVTGAHRSGSTWVGRMLDLSPEVGYIHEPFNRNSGISGKLFKNWFTYINSENEDQYKNQIERYIAFKYPLMKKLSESKSARDVGRSFRDFSMYTRNRILMKRPLVKDPISIFSAEWLYHRFNMDVIVLVRHPAAFVGSIKKAGWRSGMKNYLNQPLLLATHLSHYKDEIERQMHTETDLIEEGILLWNMIHSVIVTYREMYDDQWLFLRHEDISEQPLLKFRQMYDFAGLTYTEKVRSAIEEFTSVNEENNKLKRDSKANIKSWEKRLTSDEVERVKKGTEKVSAHFYFEDDW